MHQLDTQRSDRLAWQAPSWVGYPIRRGAATFRRTIGRVDRYLSRIEGVKTFSDDPRCILRYAPALARQSVLLTDGVAIAPGDLIIDIHCWNERIRPMPKGGPDLAWAQHASAGLRHSLRLLATALEDLPELRNARACRARVNFVGRGCSNESVTRIISRLGFEDVAEGSSMQARFHDVFENVLIGALVWTHNPEALRRDKLIRERRPVWSSRSRVLGMHGSSNEEPGSLRRPDGANASTLDLHVQ